MPTPHGHRSFPVLFVRSYLTVIVKPCVRSYLLQRLEIVLWYLRTAAQHRMFGR